MPDRRPLPMERIKQQVAGDPVLADFVSPLPSLIRRGEKDIAKGFERMAELVGALDRSACVQVTLGDRRDARHWCLMLDAKGTKILEDRTERPDIEILTTGEVWSKIMAGQISPLEAFGQGQLRIRGDIRLARDLTRKLQGK